MKIRLILLAAFLILLFPAKLLAQTSKNFEREPHKLLHNGVLYQFKFIPVQDSKGELMWHEGEMSGTRSDGSLIFSEKTQMRPGCDMKFPAISQMDIPLADGSNPESYILFCEATDGTSNLHRLHFYHEDKGAWSAIEVNSAPQIYFTNKIPEVITYNKVSLSGVGGSVAYPVIHKIIADASWEIKFVAKNIKSSSEQYKKILESPYYSEAHFRGDRMNVRAPIGKLIILLIIQDRQAYCELIKEISDKDFLGKIENTISAVPVSTIQCQEP